MIFRPCHFCSTTMLRLYWHIVTQFTFIKKKFSLDFVLARGAIWIFFINCSALVFSSENAQCDYILINFSTFVLSIKGLFKMACSQATISRTTKVSLLSVEVRNPSEEMLQIQSEPQRMQRWFRSLPVSGWNDLYSYCKKTRTVTLVMWKQMRQ